MIVNDKKNEKTIDTEKNIYITLKKHRTREDILFFELCKLDGDVIIYFYANRKEKRICSSEHLVTYFNFRYFAKSLLDYEKYKNNIDKLIMQYCHYYGASVREVYASGKVKVECVVDHSGDSEPSVVREEAADV